MKRISITKDNGIYLSNLPIDKWKGKSFQKAYHMYYFLKRLGYYSEVRKRREKVYTIDGEEYIKMIK